ncbi:hypothetical protein [Vreelandella venusta]|uniref:hypothetical protein n=1 Tax=Vreelandella venusta TaxID=44935 RepID=UPI00116CFA0D|nr:hypothetical protein [Halomonas venusta]GEK52384.1 hypothetical protein HVE01_31050 [Halomonas venusta]
MPHDLHACHMSLYPTKDSLVTALSDIEQELGTEQTKRIFPLIMSYHNTLLMEVSKQVANDPIGPPPAAALPINVVPFRR